MDNLILASRLGCIAAWLLVAFVGWRLFLTRRRRIGNTLLGVALAGLSAMAAWPARVETVLAKVETVNPLPATVIPLEETIFAKAQTAPMLFIASPTKAVYHRANGCGHTAWLKTVREFETRETAENAGFRPCTNCFKETHVSLK